MFYPSCLHTHSQFCDGKATMAQMAEKAADFGFVSLGFSSHSPLPYENDWAMREEAYPAYFAEIARLKELYKNNLFTFKAGDKEDFLSKIIYFLENKNKIGLF